MDSRPAFHRRLWQYLGSLEKWGLVMSALGLLPAAIDFVALLLGQNPPIHPLLALVIYIVAFGWANFRLFEKLSSSDLEFVTKSVRVTLNRWLQYDGEVYAVDSELVVTLHITTDIINNALRAAFIDLNILSVDSTWKCGTSLPARVARVDRKPATGIARSDTPFRMEAGEMLGDAHIGAEIHFRVPDTRTGFEYVGSLSHLAITLGTKQPGQSPILLPFECDVSPILEKAKEDLETRIQHSKSDASSSRLVKSLEELLLGRQRTHPDTDST
jgi:hypothetical protein